MDYNQIADYQQLLRLVRKTPQIFKMAKVKSVDTGAGICVCEDPTGSEADWPRVFLHAGADGPDQQGIIVVPALGSIVFITQLDGMEYWFVALCSDIDGVIVRGPNGFNMVLDAHGNVALNGGHNGGLVNLPMLLTELTKLDAQVQAIATALTSWVPVPNDGGAALKTVASGLLNPLPAPDFAPGPLTDNKITH